MSIKTPSCFSIPIVPYPPSGPHSLVVPTAWETKSKSPEGSESPLDKGLQVNIVSGSLLPAMGERTGQSMPLSISMCREEEHGSTLNPIVAADRRLAPTLSSVSNSGQVHSCTASPAQGEDSRYLTVLPSQQMVPPMWITSNPVKEEKEALDMDSQPHEQPNGPRQKDAHHKEREEVISRRAYIACNRWSVSRSLSIHETGNLMPPEQTSILLRICRSLLVVNDVWPKSFAHSPADAQPSEKNKV